MYEVDYNDVGELPELQRKLLANKSLEELDQLTTAIQGLWQKNKAL